MKTIYCANGPYSDLIYNTSGGVPGQDNLYAIFDLNRSGAGLAWDYLHPSQSDSDAPLGWEGEP